MIERTFSSDAPQPVSISTPHESSRLKSCLDFKMNVNGRRMNSQNTHCSAALPLEVEQTLANFK